jgi:farnesyl-diphosphate farnesyltransferase
LHLETVAELEEYCHYVAGTVGTMLCDLFAIARPGWSDTRLERMRRLAPRFGLALQLTNILQDVEDDARRGNFFVPRTVAADHRLRPDEMLDPARREPALAVVRDLARHAARACDAALEFTLLIPRRDMRLRLFCLWPLFLAIRTLSLAVRSERRFETGTRPRVGRAEVRWCLGRALVRVASNDALRRLYASEILRLDPRLA